MSIKLKEGKKSNYEVVCTFEKQDIEELKQNSLKDFQKDFKLDGFRAGHVPLHIVEKNIRPEYLQVGILEESVNQSIRKVLKDHPEIKFIGQPYDIAPENKDEKIVVSYKLDVYPEPTSKTKKRESFKPKKINSDVTDSEVEESMLALKRQYAKYDKVEEITIDTFAKIKFSIVDKDSKEIDKGTLWLDKQDMEEFKELQNIFLGKKTGEKTEAKYDEKKLPATLHCKNKEEKPAMINFDIAMIEKQILPDFSDEEISKLFGNDKISTYKDLEAEVRRVLAEQKEQKEYAEVIEELVKTAEKEFDFEVPRTLIESDVKRRMEMMAKRAGGEEMFKKYLENIGEEQAKKMNDEMSASAEESLKKFFVLKSITDTLGFTEVDRNNTVELEKKLYDHFSGSKK